MSAMGDKVSQKPKTTIAIIIILTIIFTYFGSSFQNDADPEAFNPDHELIKADSEAEDLFGAQDYSVSILSKANDQNLLEMDDIKTLIDLEEAIRSDQDVASAIRPSQNNPTGFASCAELMIMSFGFLQSRADINGMLAGINMSLWELASTLDNSSLDNNNKTIAIMTILFPIFENITVLQNNNDGSIPLFNRTAAYAALDAISLLYGPDPVPTYLQNLKNHDVEGAKQSISYQISQMNAAITSILNHSPLLQSIIIDPVNGTNAEDGLYDLAQVGLPTMEAGANSIDESIQGMYYGLLAMLTADFQASNGSTAKGAIIYIVINSDLGDSDKSSIENKIHDIAEDEEGDLKYGVLGNELINEEIQETMDISQMFLLILVFVLIVLILFLTFRSLFDTVLTILSLGMAIMWMNGIAILLGYQGSIIAQVAPILLVGLGVDYGIHMIMRFREEKNDNTNKKAIAIAISTVGMALLLATITTSIGFMSNTFSSLTVLKEFAIMVTLGIVSSFIVMTTFLPAVKYAVSERRDKKYMENASKPKKEKDFSKNRFVPFVTFGAKAGDRAPWAVLLILVILSGIAGYGASQLDTEFDFRDFLPTDTEAYQNFVYLMDEFPFGDEEYGNFYIKGDIANPEVLMAINETISRTNGDKQVLQGYPVYSIISVMNKFANPTSVIDVNQSYLILWSQSHTDGDGIPDKNIKELFDILYNFEYSNDDMISVVHRDETTGTYDAAFISVRVNSDNLRKADVLVEELNDDAQPLKDLDKAGTIDKIWVVGDPVVTNVVITEMNEGQIRSIAITLLTSFVVLTIVFFALERSVVLGLITMIPVALVILWILGTMLLFGYDLNVMTITIASLTVGMGITYSIHVSERFTEDLKNIENVGEACENTLTHTGMALAGAFLTTAGGFGVLYFHKLPPLQQFGVLIALSITYSFLASAYVLPTFLILWAKWRNNYRAKRGIVEDIKEEKSEDEKSEGEEIEENGIERDVTEEEKDDLKEEPDTYKVKVKGKKD